MADGMAMAIIAVSKALRRSGSCAQSHSVWHVAKQFFQKPGLNTDHLLFPVSAAWRMKAEYPAPSPGPHKS